MIFVEQLELMLSMFIDSYYLKAALLFLIPLAQYAIMRFGVLRIRQIGTVGLEVANFTFVLSNSWALILFNQHNTSLLVFNKCIVSFMVLIAILKQYSYINIISRVNSLLR
jgi:hypothetical protein